LSSDDFVSQLGGLLIAFGFDGSIELGLEFLHGVDGEFLSCFSGETLEDLGFVGFGEGFFLAEAGEEFSDFDQAFVDGFKGFVVMLGFEVEAGAGAGVCGGRESGGAMHCQRYRMRGAGLLWGDEQGRRGG
jgi:hypothetical protein